MRIIPISLIGFGIGCLVLGLMAKDPVAVLDIAIRICLSCMGLE